MTERTLSSEAHLVEAVRAIEASRRRIAVVVSAGDLLIGTLTDGDVRRCLLAGGNLQTPVFKAMNHNPITAIAGSSDGYLLDLMRAGNVAAVPLVDGQGRFVKLVHLSDLAPGDDAASDTDFSFAVIMAGGEGMRLRPITEKIPKSMVDICGVPLLERQILRLAKAGVKRVYLAVNYLSQVIEEHFGQGADFGIEICYLREREKLGTGGALALVPEVPKNDIVVMNGDILTTSDFGCLNAFHKSHKAEVTIAAVDYHISVPFGVIHNEGQYVTGLAEKPSQRFLCNAGIYAVSPKALSMVPGGGPFNMTDLINACLAKSLPVAIFPVHEYWSDIGTPDELGKARNLFRRMYEEK